MLMQIGKHDLSAIVKCMNNNGHPKASTPHKQITQQCTQQHPWYKSIELEMSEAEDRSSQPNGPVNILCPFLKHLLQASAKEYLLTDCRNKRNNNQVNP